MSDGFSTSLRWPGYELLVIAHVVHGWLFVGKFQLDCVEFLSTALALNVSEFVILGLVEQADQQRLK